MARSSPTESVAITRGARLAPREPQSEIDGRFWAIEAARAADDKLGIDTVVIDVGDVLAITDYFVVSSGSNSRQVKSIVDEIERRLAEDGGPRPRRAEGLDTFEWALVDYGPFVVHVFDTDTRGYYDLERLWRDRPLVDWSSRT